MYNQYGPGGYDRHHRGNGYDRGRQEGRGPPRDGPHYRGGRGGGDHDRSRSRNRPNLDPKRQDRQDLERNGLVVKTNKYRVTVSTPTPQKRFVYHVQILPAKRLPLKNEKGEIVRDEAGRIKEWRVEVVSDKGFFTEGLPQPDPTGNARPENRNDRSSNLSRRILNKMQAQLKEKGHHFVHDGTNIAYSTSPLFQKKAAPTQEGMYGPADDGMANRPQPKQEAAFELYDIRVKRECEEDDWEGEMTKNRWFKVKLTEVGEHKYSFEDNRLVTDQPDMFLQLLNIAFKNPMLSRMKAFGRSPRMFFFNPEEQTREICGRKVAEMQGCLPPSLGELCIGLIQAAHITGNKDVFLIADFVHSWIRPEKTRTNPPQPIMILQPDRHGGGTLAGEKITRLDQPVPIGKRYQIEQALRKLTFHIRYECGPQWVAKMRSKGMDEIKIKKIQKCDRRRNQRVYKSTETKEPSVIWAADDVTLHSFPAVLERDEEGKPTRTEKCTVASYFESRYDIKLRYPKMPLIRISKTEYFPVEFLRQALGEVRGANTEQHKTQVLAVNDEFGSTRRVDHTTRLLSEIAEARQSILGPLQLHVEEKPLECRAKVLQTPELSFANKAAPVQDGSWNLNGANFKTVAHLNSFAVINLMNADFSIRAEAIMEGVFNALSRHNVWLPNNLVASRSILPHVLVEQHLDGNELPGLLYDLFRRAIDKAKRYFSQDVQGAFRQHKVFFRTVCRNGHSQYRNELCECLVIPTGNCEKVSIMLPDTNMPTHKFINPHTTNEEYARLQYRVHRQGGGPLSVDAFDLRFQAGRHEAKVGDSWERVDNVEIVYKVNVNDEWHEVPARELEELHLQPAVSVNSSDIELSPSVLFVIIPQKATQLYDLLKYFSNFEFGIQSQVIVRATVKSQRKGTDQYFSNIAAKLNAKLSNGFTKACAWGTTCISSGMPLAGLPWVSECPTLIMGYSMSAGKGQDSKMVVAGTACLDNNGMRCCHDSRIQEKASTVSSYVLKEITKNLALQFYLHGKVIPKRLLVYRNGGQDGFFPEILGTEMKAIRKAFYELNKDKSCENSCEEGCHFCCPLITFIVAQSQHGTRIVPAHEERTRNNSVRNVPSGTCVDDPSVMSPPRDVLADEDSNVQDSRTLRPFEDVDPREKRFDFPLVSHGGLKGTSKPVLYRTLWNESIVFCPKSSTSATALTSDKLQQLTYAMSFSYATATKAPRLVPVLLYSARLAKVEMGYKEYVFDEHSGRRFEPNYTLDSGSTVFVHYRDEQRIPDARVLPDFSPFSDGEVEDPMKWRIPFRPHLSA